MDNVAQQIAYYKMEVKQAMLLSVLKGIWNGRTILIDDGMPVEDIAESASCKGDGYTKYTTYILGQGAIIIDDIGNSVPYEMHREANS